MQTRLLLGLLTIYAALPVHVLSHQSPAASPLPAKLPGNGFTVAGVVLQRGSNQPLKHVTVSLASVEHREEQLSCVTPGNGQFVFAGIPAGKYSLEAQLRGFVQAFRGNEGYSTAIVVGPNLDSEHITFLLDAAASISGSVFDQEGEPIRDAQVFLFHRGISSGRLRTLMQGQVNTNSSGAFHFGQLRPGTYFVGVSARPWYAVPSAQSENSGQNANPPELDVAYPVTYYSDSLDPLGASPITLSQGGAAEVSITLRAVPALRLAVNAGSSQNVNVAVSAAGPGDVPIPINAAQFRQENEQEILGLAPGHYVVTLQRFGPARHRVTGVEAAGTKTLDLTSNATLDLNDIPQMSISGQIRVEGAERPKQLAVWLLNVNSGRATGGSAGPDGSFKVDQLSISPGAYEIRVGNTPDLYIKSIAVRGADYANGVLNVVEGASIQMSIVAAKGLTRVNGIAQKDGKPFPGAMVLLLTQGSPQTGNILRDQSDSDGTFTLYSAPPGRYALIAIDDGRGFAYRDASIISPYLEQAQVVDLPLPADTNIKVNVQHRRR